VIVTISRAYGAGGLAVAEGLASALGYALLAEELTTTVAARMGTSPEAASQATAQPSLSERILGSLGAGTAELQAPDAPRPGDFDEALRSEIERTIRERAAQGNVVILGRGAGYMLAGTPGLFRAFLTGAREWRIGRVMDAFGKSREESIADLDRIDATRRKTAKERFKVHWGDASFYDMTLDVSTFDIDGSVAVLLAAIRAAEAVRTR
jgi:cytidylate kinase